MNSENKYNDNWDLREVLQNNSHAIVMLVPSPNSQDIRAQIGDRSADEYDSDLSENEIEYVETGDDDDENLQNICYSTTLHIVTKSPLASAKIVPIENNDDESFTSMIDIEPLSLEVEKNFDKIESDVKQVSPDIVTNVDNNVEDEELFDSIVEISSINDHKNSIDEAFENILKSDITSNSEDAIARKEEKQEEDETFEKLKKEEEIAQRVHETLQNLLKEEEEVTKKIHEAVNAAPLKDNSLFLPTVHEAINGTLNNDENITYRRIEVDNDNRTRYRSPLFQNYNLAPIKTIKITENNNNDNAPKSAPIISNIFDPLPCHSLDTNKQRNSIPAIPHDDSINNLLHTTSLISRSHTNLSKSDGKFNFIMMKKNPIMKKSLIFSNLENLVMNNDPEKFLMENIVPGINVILLTFEFI